MKLKSRAFSWLSSLRNCLLVALLLYSSLLLALVVFPELQNYLIYLHWFNYPFTIDSTGESLGFRSASLRSFYIKTPDDMQLGAWHVLPKKYAPPLPLTSASEKSFGILSMESEAAKKDRFEKLLKSAKRVFLYFHGNAGNRATFKRPFMYKMLTTMGKQDSHVVAIDYRGFGDSTRTLPTEDGLQTDAIASFKHLVKLGVSPSKIILVGHSLGSGVANYLARYLENEGQSPGGVILIAAYSSIADAALGYPVVPIMYPFTLSALAIQYAKYVIHPKWVSEDNVKHFTVPLLILHGKDDFEIGVWQSEALFKAAIGARGSSEETKNSPVTRKIGREGVLNTFDSVWYLEVAHAGHNTVPAHLIVQDAIESWLLSHQL